MRHLGRALVVLAMAMVALVIAAPAAARERTDVAELYVSEEWAVLAFDYATGAFRRASAVDSSGPFLLDGGTRSGAHHYLAAGARGFSGDVRRFDNATLALVDAEWGPSTGNVKGTAAANGSVYLLHTNETITRWSPSETLLATYTVGGGTATSDVGFAVRGSTAYYVDSRVVKRFDLAAGVDLADFWDYSPARVIDLSVHRDGAVVVITGSATYEGSAIEGRDAAGGLLWSFVTDDFLHAGAWAQLNIRAVEWDGRYLWVAGKADVAGLGDVIYRVVPSTRAGLGSPFIIIPDAYDFGLVNDLWLDIRHGRVQGGQLTERTQGGQRQLHGVRSQGGQLIR